MKRMAIAALLVLWGTLGIFYLTSKPQPEGRGLYAPNVMHRIAVPPIAPEMIGRDYPQLASAMHDDLRINGKKVVTVDRDRFDMAHTMVKAQRGWHRVDLVDVH